VPSIRRAATLLRNNETLMRNYSKIGRGPEWTQCTVLR